MPIPRMKLKQSSNILAIGHDGASLYVTFKSGHTYIYNHVPPAVFDDLDNASSTGSFFNEHIKNTYDGKPFHG